MMDLLFLTHNRLEFTKASAANLLRNTNWDRVSRLIVYDDNSIDGTASWVKDYLVDRIYSFSKVDFRRGQFGSPVAIMNDYILNGPAEMFAKIDSDTMVPPGWLDVCLDVMEGHPDLHFLGIEAFRPVASPISSQKRSVDAARFVGGIGLFRTSAFDQGLPVPQQGSRQGFTQFQERNDWIQKGWLNPALPVFLLDWIPREPWRSLTNEYVKNGWNRDWHEIFPDLCPYPEERKDLWDWWENGSLAILGRETRLFIGDECFTSMDEISK